MACDSWREKLDAYADNEVSVDAQREFETHLRACPSCAADLAARVKMKIAVKRAAGRRFVPAAQFRRKIESQLIPQKRNRRGAWIWIPAAALASAALIAALWLANRPTANSVASRLSEIADLHVAALASPNPVDVISTDQHTVKPWFEGKLPFAVNLPDLTNTPFALLGGRVAYLDQAPGAGLLFQYRKHRLSVFVFQDRAEWKGLGSQNKPEQRASFWFETWSAHGLRYFVIGDTSAQNVQQLSNLMKNAANPE